MNAVEIEEAISTLAEQPFQPDAFPYAFLEAFGRKATEIKRLQSSASNKSDLGGVLQRNHIHIKVCGEGEVSTTFDALKVSPATTKSKARFVLATDGTDFQAEDLITGETIACRYIEFPDHFGFFLPLAGISTVKQIRESAFDIKATGRLNRLYVELLKDNPEWGTEERRHDMNHFMARLIFCFFAEDTGIFSRGTPFTTTIEQFSDKDSSNTHWVISEIFRAMNTKLADRPASGLRNWANAFPYVNGGLFSGDTDVPRFSKIARSYLLHIGSLDWTKINPDIFGSMIQAVADEGERSALGMHYTSVPNILKVLNPLFLDDLRAQLEEAGDNPRKLLNLRNRMAKIRVFDPACGSGNFLVIAYKEMRAIEAMINQRRGEADRKTDIPKTNFRGIELRDFAAEIARLALIIAEFQCDVTYRGEVQARAEFLPLDRQNWITQGNALRLDWLSICPPTGTGVRFQAEDLFHTPLDQAQIDFENEGGETYICGNPPYVWGNERTTEQKEDLESAIAGETKSVGSLDYVCGWFFKARRYLEHTPGLSAFVTTNSINQGRQVGVLWPLLLRNGFEITFAHVSLKWANLASNNAGVTVNIVGFGKDYSREKILYSDETQQVVDQISPYLVPAATRIVEKSTKPISAVSEMRFGGMPIDGGHLLLDSDGRRALINEDQRVSDFLRPIVGSQEMINATPRYCIWVTDESRSAAERIQSLVKIFAQVAASRRSSNRAETRKLAAAPHKFGFISQNGTETVIAVPAISSENREYLPVQFYKAGTIITNRNYGIFNAPLWNAAILMSKAHLAWIGTVCGRLEMRYSYTNTLGWNTFPVPTLTEKNKADLTACAEDILLAREAHFPATIADLYDPERMPENLRQAHDRNDEVLERIYIGRRFKNDTERLEKLFEMYAKMTSKSGGRARV